MEYLIMAGPSQDIDDLIPHLVDRQIQASRENILDSIHDYEFIGVQCGKLNIIYLHSSQLDEYIRLIDEKLKYYCKNTPVSSAI